MNVYELNLEGLEIEHLERDQKWYSYIYRNRRAKDTCDADVVIGPIANDTIYDTMGILTSGESQSSLGGCKAHGAGKGRHSKNRAGELPKAFGRGNAAMGRRNVGSNKGYES